MNIQLRWLPILMVSVVIGLSFHRLQAVELTGNGTIIIPDLARGSVEIDGDLDEEVWRNPGISEDFFTYMPLYGDKLDHKTTVWIAYDSEKLYFAFKCYDNEPNKIKTSLSPRDKMFKDDWVAVLLDAMGNKQTSYEFYVNPSGIQGDNLNSAVSGLDSAPDFVWESAGKITAEGYQVEIGVPLESIRFRSGKKVKMGLLLLRNITRLGTAGTWPKTGPGQTDFNFMNTVIYENLKPSLKLEVLPNFVYSRDAEQESAGKWKRTVSRNLGVSVKYGINSSITAEATVNPDFSQVESDAFQVEVNRRYPVFYSEKRPFFMEGMEVFDFGLVTGGMMTSAVHTRHIVDPSWAAKLTGSSGKMSFAFLAANDQYPGQEAESGVNPYEGRDALWGIARGKYNIGSDNSLGFLFSGRHFAGGKNDVMGLDLQYRFFKNTRLNVSYLSSGTREPGEAMIKKGSGLNAMLQFMTPRFRAWAVYERYDRNFIMSSAFINRTGFDRGLIYLMPDFRIEIKGIPWFRSLRPFAEYSVLRDFASGLDDTTLRLGVNMYFTRRGLLSLEYRKEKEAWQGQSYNPKYFYSQGRLQLFKWLYLTGYFRYGDQIYYGPGEPFLGSGHQFQSGFTFQPDIKLSLGLDFIHNVLYGMPDSQREYGKKTRQKFYSIDILNMQTTYQFNKYFFIRGVLRYDGYRKKLLTDFLASVTLIPGSVVHLGYGSLYERKEWQEDRWVWMPESSGLTNMKNGLFFKISYLWRIK